MIEGKLSFDKAQKAWKMFFYNEKKKGDGILFCRDKSHFSTDLQLIEDTEIAVSFERLPNGDAVKIRPQGQEWQAATSQSASTAVEQDTQTQDETEENIMTAGDFHNPYNFVPAVPRDQVTNGLGDHAPIGHDRFHHDKLTGKLSVTMTVKTPLLVLDTTWYDEDNNDHKTFDVLLEDEKPVINPTAIKGMLRSAYEAVTNSRLSVFNKHDERLAFRSEAKLDGVPARVCQLKDKSLAFRVMKTHLVRYGKAAKLNRYAVGDRLDNRKGENNSATKFSDKTLPTHKQSVWVQFNNEGYVTQISPRTLGRTNAGWINGWVNITGANVKDKKCERVFIEDASDSLIKITEHHLKLWRELIKNYREIHKKDLAERKNRGEEPSDYLGQNPGKTAWSRHIFEPNAEELKLGTLCYLIFKQGSETEIEAVIPVTISRRLHKSTPLDLLPEKLRPAKSIKELSPADRVFGWVGQNLKSRQKAYRGHVRIGEIVCTNALVETFTNPLPLNILGQPKPQQGRFYVARNKDGNAQQKGLTNEAAGYNNPQTKGLRGRKVYPHHNGLPSDYWTNPTNTDLRTEKENFFKEYRRRRKENDDGQMVEQQDSQNRSVKGWVNPQTTFAFDVHFTNISQVELGALIWLLRLPANHFHRFGGGKPFGFGSVKLDLTDSQITSGEDLKDFYQSLDDNATPNKESKTVDDCKSEFEKAVKEAYPNGNFLESFLRMAKGFDDNLPIQYPRLQQQPNAEGKNFEWFVSNNKNRKLTLQNLNNENGLPRNPENQQNNQRRRNNR